ncbi:MAG: 4Fe-4S binding protein [Muribaculaceae bacterium]|nr:4Fe-4S binding protein [Muribaculaceae bacterium]
MNISEVCLITFSPTGTSRKIGEAIVEGTGVSSVNVVDLTTVAAADRMEVAPQTLTVITVPVYAGHVAPLAIDRMQRLRSAGSPAVLVVVYGNRAYEKALVELEAVMKAHGFRIIAGATFVGEHSYSNADFPIAAGRPDEADLAFARDFGSKIRTKISETKGQWPTVVDFARIARPHQPLMPLLRFVYKVIMLRYSGSPLPLTPEVDVERCSHCGHCAALCPAGAIERGNESRTDRDKCIKCCACVKGCPSRARVYDTPFGALLSKYFSKRKEPRVIL